MPRSGAFSCSVSTLTEAKHAVMEHAAGFIMRFPWSLLRYALSKPH